MNNGSTGKIRVAPLVEMNSIGAGSGRIIVGSDGPTMAVDCPRLPVVITKKEEKNGNTTIISNSTNILATDIVVGGVAYFFKTPLEGMVSVVRDYATKSPVSFTTDTNFIYFTTPEKKEIEYSSGTITVESPVSVYLNYAYQLNNRYYVDNKTYRISSYYGNIKLIFNSTGLVIIPGRSITRVMNSGLIVHLDSIAAYGFKAMDNDKSLSTEDLDSPRFSSSELNDYMSLSNSTQTAPFIYPKTIFKLQDDTVMAEIYIDDAGYTRKEFSIDGLVLLDSTTANSVKLTSIKVKSPASTIFATVDKIDKTESYRFCGPERLSIQHGKGFKLNEYQTFISGVRTGNLVQFSLTKEETEYSIVNLSVVDKNGNVVESVLVEDTIFSKSEVEIGVKYDDREPGIFV